MLSKFKNSKGTCDYLTVGGVRVPSRNVLITITDSNGNVRSSSISAKSKGNKGAHTTPSKLKKMLKNNPGMTVTAQVKVDEGSAHALSASMVFDPSRCRGKDVDGTASIDEAWSDVPDALWDVALKGVSYGKYKGNIRQMKWLIENGKSIEGISSVIITPNTYSPHPSAEIITMALIDYIDAGHTIPGALGAMLTSDEMLLPPDAIKRAQTLGYGNTMSPSNLRNGYSFLRDSTLPSSVKASYMQQAAATATFASSANRLTEQAILSQVALNDSDERVRLSAVERVTDQKILRQVALNDSKPKVRLNAVSRLADQEILSQIAVSDSDVEVRKSAVGNITDQHQLAKIVVHASACIATRKVAISRLNDQELLGRVMQHSVYPDVRKSCTFRVQDQAILSQVALNDSDNDVRRAAVYRVTDQAVLRQVVLNDSDNDVRRAAVGRVTGQDILSQVALNDSDGIVRWYVVGRVTDQDILSQVALNDSYPDVRRYVVGRVTDQAILSQVVLNDSNNYVRRAAVGRVTDHAVLRQVALSDDDQNVRKAALVPLTDQVFLSQVALNDSDIDVRERATSMLTDEAILKHISNNDRSRFVRREADLRLERLARLSRASAKASGKASAKEQWAAKLAAGRCPVCDGKPFEIILMSGNTGCVDCASTGKASAYTSRRVGKK